MFKKCGKCNKEWSERHAFLSDSDINLIGYQPNFKNLGLGLFLFNHACKTTIGIHASEFTDLYSGKIHTEPLLLDTEECYGFCQNLDNLDPCDRKCECVYVREIIQLIKSKHG